MRFDAIVGNPPYQMADGGALDSAKPIYNLFIENAKKIKPKYISMIVPARWMTGGKGLDGFRDRMIHDTHIRALFDYASSKNLFNDVDVRGGICYFLRDENYNNECFCVRYDCDGKTESRRNLCEGDGDIFIREPLLVGIKKKVDDKSADKLFRIDFARNAYGLQGETTRNASKFGLPEFSDNEIEDGYKILGLDEKGHRCWKYLPKDYPIPRKNEGLDKYKVFIVKSPGCRGIGEVPSTPVLSTPVLSTPGELCTETFLQIGPFETKIEAENLLKYIKTKFFRALVGIKKQTQQAARKVYQYVPIENFTQISDIDWTKSISEIDQQLYKKYGLSQDEIDFIESKVQEMR